MTDTTNIIIVPSDMPQLNWWKWSKYSRVAWRHWNLAHVRSALLENFLVEANISLSLKSSCDHTESYSSVCRNPR